MPTLTAECYLCGKTIRIDIDQIDENHPEKTLLTITARSPLDTVKAVDHKSPWNNNCGFSKRTHLPDPNTARIETLSSNRPLPDIWIRPRQRA